VTNISLIITCYNSSLTIEIIIKQILEIIKDNDEIVIVDDGSTDNTTKIIKHIDDKRINLICLGRVGRTKALNTAIKNSKGKYLFINDADDIPSKVRFKESLKILENGYDAVFGQQMTVNNIDNSKIKIINDNIERINRTKLEKLELLTKKLMFRTNSLTHSTLGIKKDKFLEIGFYDENIEVSHDLDLYYRFIINNLKVCISNRVFTGRSVGRSHWRNYNKYTTELLSVRKKYRHILKPSIFTYIYDIKIFIENIINFRK
tara:strand:+ start:3835 stop:4617 length:783 start_codon:yes stop_codon:yes gene_type:complete